MSTRRTHSPVFLDAAARAADAIAGGMDPDFAVHGCAYRNGVSEPALWDYLFPNGGRLRKCIRDPSSGRTYYRDGARLNYVAPPPNRPVG